MESRDRPIALVGLMGAGKSTVARLLGERLHARVMDLDAQLEAAEGCSVWEMFERHGEAAFRRREAEILEQALASGAQVLACGGGVVLDPVQRERLKQRCRTVWLEVSPEEAARRVGGNGRIRPLLASGRAEDRLATLLRERAAHYLEVALLRVVTDGLSPAEVSEAILAAPELAAGGGSD
jgi:shikimate kinase